MLREIISEKRIKLGLTQSQLAQKTGLTQAQISDFESGKREMNSSNLEKIISAMGMRFMDDNPFMEKAHAQWDLAKEAASILIEKGIKNVDAITKEEMVSLTGFDDIMLLQVFSKTLFEKYVDSKIVSEHNTYNYFLTLVKFHIAMLN